MYDEPSSKPTLIQNCSETKQKKQFFLTESKEQH